MTVSEKTSSHVWVIISLAALLPSSARAVDFNHDVVPILKKHCAECHSGGEAQGGFSINNRDLFLESDAATLGNGRESYFIELIESDDPDWQMPPSDHDRVAPEEIETLVRWVDQQMPWQAGFQFGGPSYVPPLLPRRVEFPAGPGMPLDRLIGAYLEQNELSPLRPADDRTFVRRVSLDLVGLIPDPKTVEQFVRDDSPDKRARLVDSLLGRDVDYADHWMSFWNDLLRNDYSGTGFITGGRSQISRWLYASLLSNAPMDEMTRELVAPRGSESSGFIDGIEWRGTVSAAQSVEVQFAQSVAQSLLGINLKCASCHDSFIDRWKLQEAYSLAAIYSETPLEVYRCDKPVGKTASAAWLFPELGQVDAEASKSERLNQLADLITHRDNGRYARTIVNRLWGQLMGRGLVHPMDAMHLPPWDEDVLEYLAGELVAQDYDLKAILRLIATSDAYAAASEMVTGDPGLEKDYRFRGPRAKRMTAEQFVDSVWRLSGASPSEPDAPVLRYDPQDGVREPMALSAQEMWASQRTPGSQDDSAGEDKAAALANQPNPDAVPAGQSVTFVKRFSITKPIRRAFVVATADNEFEMYVNRRRVASSIDWTQPQFAFVQANLKSDNRTDNNEWVIVARNAGTGVSRGSSVSNSGTASPAVVIAEMQIEFEDGETMTVTSGTDWETSWKRPKAGRDHRIGNLLGPWKASATYSARSYYDGVRRKMSKQLAATGRTIDRPVRASLMKNSPLMKSLGRPNRDQIVTSRPSELTTLEAIDLSNGAELAGYLAQGAQRWAKRDLPIETFVASLYQETLGRPPTESERRGIDQWLGDSLTPTKIEDVLWAVVMLPEYWMVR